jgi:hypothetical protein
MTTTIRSILFIGMVVVMLAVLGLTAERTAARLAWAGAAILSLTVGLWGLL